MSESLISTATESSEAPPQEAPQESATEQSGDELILGKYKSADDLAKAYKELESKLGGKEEDLRAKIIEELQAEAYSDRPASAGEYQLPDFVDAESAVDNNLLKWWSDHAFENGYSQEEFEQGIKMYAEAATANQPDLDAEIKRLGDNANTRIQATSMFAAKFFPKDVMPAIERMCETAEGVMALEVIMDAMKDGSFSGQTQPASAITEQSLREMMQDERYHNPVKRDPFFVKQVEDGFKKLYR